MDNLFEVYYNLSFYGKLIEATVFSEIWLRQVGLAF